MIVRSRANATRYGTVCADAGRSGTFCGNAKGCRTFCVDTKGYKTFRAKNEDRGRDSFFLQKV